MTENRSLSLSRRSLLGTAFAAPMVALSGVPASAQDVISLKGIAATKGLRFGASARVRSLADEAFVDLLLEQCGVVAALNEFKWPEMEPASDRVEYSQTDRMALFGWSRRLRQRGHAIIWDKPGNIPRWVTNETRGAAEMAALLVERTRAVTHRYRGIVDSWDVVNEAIKPGSGRPVAGPIYRSLGWEFASLAFKTARETDPRAELVYNDFVLPGWDRHQRGILGLLDRLARVGIKVDALGVQGHLWIPESRADWPAWRRFLAEIAQRDMKILITELDVIDNGPQADPVARDRIAADRIAQFLDVTLDEKAVSEVMVRSLTDKYEGLTWAVPRADKAKRRPSPFDAENRPKPIFHAIANSMGSAPAR